MDEHGLQRLAVHIERLLAEIGGAGSEVFDRGLGREVAQLASCRGDAPGDLEQAVAVVGDDAHRSRTLRIAAQLDEAWPEWETWLITAGVAGVDARRGPRFAQPSMALQAARDGLGIALCGSVLAADDLRAGRLVQPFDLSFPVNFAYHVICPESTADRPRVVAFRDWLLREARSGQAAS